MIKPSKLFATPDDQDALARWIESHPPCDRLHLYTAAGMAWNLACQTLEDENKSTIKEEGKWEGTP